MQDIFLTGIVRASMKLVFDCFVIYSSDMFAYHLCKPPSGATLLPFSGPGFKSGTAYDFVVLGITLPLKLRRSSSVMNSFTLPVSSLFWLPGRYAQQNFFPYSFFFEMKPKKRNHPRTDYLFSRISTYLL